MGAWGEGPFENDEALDWVDELAELPAGERPARIGKAFETILGGAVPTVDDGDPAPIAVAAAALVAARLPDGPPIDADEEDSEAIVLADLGSLTDLAGQARDALTQVLQESDLRRAWEEVDRFDAVLAGLQPVMDALGVDPEAVR